MVNLLSSFPFLENAALLIMEPPAPKKSEPGSLIDRCEFQFNPNQLTVGKSARVDRTPGTAEAATQGEFVGANPRTLSFEIFLDETNFLFHMGKVQKTIKKLVSCCSPTRKSEGTNHPCLPWVRLEWGSADLYDFNCLMTDVQMTAKLFNLAGDPIRATCSLSMEEVGGAVARQNPTSGALNIHSSWQVTQGDSLHSIAWQEYGDAARWREIARANGKDNPYALAPGERLAVPSRDQ
ncbi:LysM peptidoglycan-binding domain-containing protein [Streptomyces sp. H27-G5]|uniref:CIS tube protein n=1 Tax=Streptomyces sp. H27-G5 TaxID=2996698 RepID=UPI00226F27BF|nr:LysM peptidoglycan-binding domain-containing protein [Streptomyces sp. H27-G5]MCY0924101.1 LysM peptidoglycan-binding domain-containing protein [Streptomyces sp. H27-G5]